ncbi:MAG: aminotransferase class III-fold pyridoxal phosphate-dependent enzyme, partial [bacterium]
GAPFAGVVADDGARHHLRVLRHLDGRLLAAVSPHTPELLESLGERVARLDRALNDPRHPLPDADAALARPLLWQPHRADQVIERFAPLLESNEQRDLVAYFAELFRADALSAQARLRRGVIHNDANDRNVLVGGDGAWTKRVTGLIDFGDMTQSWLAADPAIAAAYAMLGKARPLDAACAVIRGYHRHHPLRDDEIAALFALMCARLCLSVCICAHQRALAPHNEYLRVSERPAWDALQRLCSFAPPFVHFLLRDACDLAPVPRSPSLVAALRAHRRRASFASVIDVDLAADPLLILDASVSSPDLGAPGAAGEGDAAMQARLLQRAIDDSGCRAAVGRYDEHRLIYADDAFKEPSGHRRTLHLGIDWFLRAGAPVFAPLDGVLHSAADHAAAFDYGGVLIVAHRIERADGDDDAIVFHTLYGHLAPASLRRWRAGDAVAAGQEIARLGDIHENGGWPPHLHFQLIADLAEHPLRPRCDTFVGVGTHQHRAVWRSLCPDPNLLLGIPPHRLEPSARSYASVLHARRRDVAPSLRLSHRAPIELARGAMQYLFDTAGRRYLDAVNNVQQVGHCHPRVVAAERRQCGVLNINTRYLHAAMADYTERLLRTFPPELCVCYLVCSGSEANDLALRLARAYTGRRGVVAIDHAYHGNLGALIDVSPYKHDGVGGDGAPAHVQVAAMPDVYRGGFDSPRDIVARCGDDVARALRDAARDGASGAAAFIAESALGCGGQIVLPDGYLRVAYAHARAAGAVCIADEVQVGFGRVGSHFWGFQTQHVTPDIVTLGKPIGNGYPLGAVITTREIAARFDNGMEYFNT